MKCLKSAKITLVSRQDVNKTYIPLQSFICFMNMDMISIVIVVLFILYFSTFF